MHLGSELEYFLPNQKRFPDLRHLPFLRQQDYAVGNQNAPIPKAPYHLGYRHQATLSDVEWKET